MTERIVRHQDREGKLLFHYPSYASFSDCDERIVCLSERDMEIILQSLQQIGQYRTRVWTTRENDYYETVSDEQWGDWQNWVSDLATHLGGYMACNENLERIAIALESMLQGQDQQTVDLFDVLEALGLDPTEEEADILEALDYMLNLPHFGSLPSFKIPLANWISSYMESRYKSAHLQLLRDMSISQRGIAVAAGGVDFASLYDTMGETADSLLVKAGYVGKAYWIWRWIDNDQIPGWLGWLSTISGLVLGSIRGAAYDIEEAIQGLFGIEGAIQDQTLTSVINCNNCTTSDLYRHLSPPGQPTYVTVDEDSYWSDVAPPTSPNTDWNEPPEEVDYKCQAANYIVDWLQAFYGNSEWGLSSGDNLITLADKFASVLASIPPIGATLSGLSSIIGLTLAYLSGGSTDIFETVNEKITDRKDDLICALYGAETVEDARQVFKDIMIEESINSLALSGLDVFLTMNNIMAILFYEPESIADLIAAKDDSCPCGDECTPLTSGLTIENGTGGHVGDGVYEIAGVFVDGWGCGAAARQVAIHNIPDGFKMTAWEIISGSVTECFGWDIYHAYEGLGSPYSGAEDSNSTGFGVPQNLGSLYVLSSTDFEIRLTLCEL